jgi:hypothetical protein
MSASAPYSTERGIAFLAAVEGPDWDPPDVSGTSPSRATDNVFTATFVHDAVDPRLFAEGRHREAADRIRQRIIRLLVRHEEPDRTWRFFGLGSRTDPDVDTTACAAAICLPRGDPAPYVAGVRRFEEDDGLFSSYLDARGHRYSWILDGGVPLAGRDRVVQGNVARLLGMAGEPCPAIWAFLERELTLGAFATGSPDYPNPAAFFYMTARARRAGGFAGDDAFDQRLRRHLGPRIRALDAAATPLTAALVLLAWLNAGGPRPAAVDLAASLGAAQRDDGGWSAEPFFVGGYGTRGLTTALALEALLRCDRAAAFNDPPSAAA